MRDLGEHRHAEQALDLLDAAQLPRESLGPDGRHGWRRLDGFPAAVDAHRYASIGTCPGSAATRSSHARTAGYGSRSKPPSSATCV